MATSKTTPHYLQKRFWNTVMIPVWLLAGWFWLLHAFDSGSLLDYFFVLFLVLMAIRSLKALLLPDYQGSRKDLHGRQTILVAVLIVFNLRSIYEVFASSDEIFFWPRSLAGGSELLSISIALVMIMAVNAVVIYALRQTNQSLAKLSNRRK